MVCSGFFCRGKFIPSSVYLNCYWYFADAELHPWQSPHQNKLLPEPSDFKTLPKAQGWAVTVSHKNLTPSSRGVSWPLQPLSIARANLKLCQAVCVWLLYWEVVCFDLHISYCCSVIFMQVVSTLCNSSEIMQLSRRAEFGTPCWPSFILSFPHVPSQCGVFMSWTWLSLAKCDCSVHKPMWM